MIKSFRGKLADGEQEVIRLGTNNGLTGYRIVKFQLMGLQPGAVSQESIVKVYSVEQSSVDGIVDFTNETMIGSAIFFNKSSVDFPVTMQVIFDNKIFNQDIFVTHSDVDASESCCYYIELEQIKLDKNEATVATLKDLRGSA